MWWKDVVPPRSGVDVCAVDTGCSLRGSVRSDASTPLMKNRLSETRSPAAARSTPHEHAASRGHVKLKLCHALRSVTKRERGISVAPSCSRCRACDRRSCSGWRARHRSLPWCGHATGGSRGRPAPGRHDKARSWVWAAAGSAVSHAMRWNPAWRDLQRSAIIVLPWGVDALRRWRGGKRLRAVRLAPDDRRRARQSAEQRYGSRCLADFTTSQPCPLGPVAHLAASDAGQQGESRADSVRIHTNQAPLHRGMGLTPDRDRARERLASGSGQHKDPRAPISR